MDVLGHSMKPVVMPSYPHMMAEDTDVWTRYLKDPITPIREVWYDVHVGRPVSLPVGADALTRRVAAGVTRKRIDVVCRVGGGFWVVEVKPFANMLALGQVISYYRLLVTEYELDGAAWPVVVCGDYDRDLADEYEAQMVGLIQVD
ncbi:hypothetical protein ES707_15313 [subsurface metagenome]